MTTQAMVRRLAPWALVGLALHLVPGPAGEFIARALGFAAGCALIGLVWWTWRTMRALPPLDVTIVEARRCAKRLREHADERDRWHAATLDAHRTARAYFERTGNREVAALYDRLIAGMEGRSYDGSVN